MPEIHHNAQPCTTHSRKIHAGSVLMCAWRIATYTRKSTSCGSCEIMVFALLSRVMRTVLVLVAQLPATLVKLLPPGGARAMVTENPPAQTAIACRFRKSSELWLPNI